MRALPLAIALTGLLLCAAPACDDSAPAGTGGTLDGPDSGADGGLRIVPEDAGDPSPPVDAEQNPVEGEGEGEGSGDGGPDREPRPVEIVCGSAPDRVVQPERLHITATVILPETICGAHLQPLQSPRDPRLRRIVALETINAPPCPPERRLATIELPLPVSGDDDVGEWTIEMIGQGPTIFRKTVLVQSAGADEPPPGETCAGERTGFVGECGAEIQCQAPTGANPVGFVCDEERGLCIETASPGDIAGQSVMRLNGVEKACRVATEAEVPAADCLEEPPEPGEDGLFPNPLEVESAVLLLEQDAEDPSRATLSFSGESFLALWSGEDAMPGRVIGNTFLGDETMIRSPGAVCVNLFFLQVPALTRYGERLVGRLSVDHLEVNCGRGCLSCELTGDVVTE